MWLGVRKASSPDIAVERSVLSRSESKAIRVPSGDQAGCVSSCGVSVRRTSPVPSAPMTKMS